MANLIETLDAYRATNPDAEVDALVMNVIREVNRKLPSGFHLEHEHLVHIAAVTRNRAIAKGMNEDRQKCAMQKVLEIVVASNGGK